ncbi:MAG: hypothetical protein ACI837_002889 [Crocinitomicaceae bacterium]|jgi:hypothetical protein
MTTMTKSVRIITSILASLMLFAGVVKFFEPIKTNFYFQIRESQLPFPTFSQWAGQFGEIAVGLTLFMLVFFWKKIPSTIGTKVFYISNILVIFILAVTIFVHVHPSVQAEILPMKSKPPFISIFMLLLVGVSLFLHKRATNTTTIV